MSKPKQRLVNLRLSRIDLVPDGDNPPAKVTLYKRRPQKEPEMVKGFLPALALLKAATIVRVRKDGDTSGGIPQTTDEIILAQETFNEWSKVKWAFHDSLSTILAGAPSAERMGLLEKSVGEFITRVKNILPEAMAKRLTDRAEALGLDVAKELGEERDRDALMERVRSFADEAVAKWRALDQVGDPEGRMKKLDLEKIPAEQREAVSDLQKAHDTAAAKVMELEKAKTEAETAKKAAEDKVAAAEAEVAKLKPVDKYVGLSPEVRKELEDGQTEIVKLREDREVDVIEKRLRPLGILGTTSEKLAPLFHRIEKSKGTADDIKEIERLLKSASELARKSEKFKELGGNGGGDTGTAFEKASAMADALRAKDSKLSKSKALEQVWDENPELYKQHVQER